MGYTAEWAGMVLSPGGIVTLVAMPHGGAFARHHRTALAGGHRTGHPGRRNVPAIGVEPRGRIYDAGLTWAISRAGLPFLFVPINVMAFSHVAREDQQRDGIAQPDAEHGRKRRHLAGHPRRTTCPGAQGLLAAHMTPVNPLYAARLQHIQSALKRPRSDPCWPRPGAGYPLSRAAAAIGDAGLRECSACCAGCAWLDSVDVPDEARRTLTTALKTARWPKHRLH